MFVGCAETCQSGSLYLSVCVLMKWINKQLMQSTGSDVLILPTNWGGALLEGTTHSNAGGSKKKEWGTFTN